MKIIRLVWTAKGLGKFDHLRDGVIKNDSLHTSLRRLDKVWHKHSDAGTIELKPSLYEPEGSFRVADTAFDGRSKIREPPFKFSFYPSHFQCWLISLDLKLTRFQVDLLIEMYETQTVVLYTPTSWLTN